MAHIGIIGAGPAGLMAAEVLGGRGHAVTVFDQMPTPGRKFLLAGRGGLNLTHSENMDAFLGRYGEAASWLRPSLGAFSPDDLKTWCEGLGQPVFVGSSGRVFPNAFKAAPLLRAWLRRLEGFSVKFVGRHRWLGFEGPGKMFFAAPEGEVCVGADAFVLAMGGGSWPRMGSDGGWVEILRGAGVSVRPLLASNCGVVVPWSEVFLRRFEGAPLKRIALEVGGRRARGEAVVTRGGLEGGVVYALSAALREGGQVKVFVDLLPDTGLAALREKLDGPRQGFSLSNFLRVRAGLSPVAIGLVQEALHGGGGQGASLAELVKAVPVMVTGMQPIERAISSAGGVMRAAVDERLMLLARPGVFVAGEMLDWEAPTGGYLLQGCFSTGVWSARGVMGWVEGRAVS